MKIAYIGLKGMPLGGGIEKYTEELGSRLVERGHEIIVYTMRHYGVKDCVFKGVKIKTVPAIRTKSLEKLTSAFVASVINCFDRNIDIVHFHGFHTPIFSPIAQMLGRKVVGQGHGIEWRREKWGWTGRTFLKLVEAPSVMLPDRVTVVSKVLKEYIREKFGRETIHIPPGVSAVEKREPRWILEQGLEPNRYVLFAARLVEEKGAHYLIDAFRAIQTDMKLLIAGDTAYAGKYKAALKRKTAGDMRIIFPGFVTGEPLEELFSNAYLFCLPSTLEGLPIALLEAMSYGNCCVASNIPENLEAIDEYGYTFRSRDVGDLRRVLADLIEHPEKVEEKKIMAARHVLRNYSWDKIADQMEALYLELVNGNLK